MNDSDGAATAVDQILTSLDRVEELLAQIRDRAQELKASADGETDS